MTTFQPFDPNNHLRCAMKKVPVPRSFISPTQYLQAPDILTRLGEYLTDHIDSGASVGVLITPGRRRTLFNIVEATLRAAGFKAIDTTFTGESSYTEVDRVTAHFRPHNVAVVVGIGGGKCLDTARMAANRLDARTVTVPTTASTDAPTAAVSVIYRDDGVFEAVEYSRANPLIVLADETVLAAAPSRYLVAGMGDAYSTFFEARCCQENAAALTGRGVRPTTAALAIAAQCREQLLAHGAAALAELKSGRPGPAFSRIVETNILLSGLGFESGGLAGAHAVAQGLTVCEDLHRNCLHGELVAIGVMTELVMEKRPAEVAEALAFFRSVGLPTHLGQIGFDPVKRAKDLDAIVACSLEVSFIHAEPMQVTAPMLRTAILEASRLGAN